MGSIKISILDDDHQELGSAIIEMSQYLDSRNNGVDYLLESIRAINEHHDLNLLQPINEVNEVNEILYEDDSQIVDDYRVINFKLGN
jgi:hypothetical protein